METFGNQPQIVIFRILLREIQGLGPQQQIRRHQVLEPCVRSERAHVDPYGAQIFCAGFGLENDFYVK